MQHVSSQHPPDVLQILWQRRRTMAVIVVVCLGAAGVYLSLAPRVYTGVSRLQVVQGLPNIGAGGGPADPEARAKNFLNTQCQLIASAAVLDRVVAHPDLPRMRTFAGAADLRTALKERLNVEPGQKDDLITVSLGSTDAVEAARVVNLVVDAYVAHQKSRTDKLAEELLRVVQSEKEQRLAGLSALRQEMQKYKLDNAVLSFVDERSNTIIQRLAQLSDAKTAAEVERMRAEASYNAVKTLLNDPAQVSKLADGAAALAPSDSANSRAYGELREELLKAEVALATGEQQFGHAHPRAEGLRRTVAAMRSRLAEVSVNALHQAWQGARAREASLAAAFEEQKALALALNDVTAEFAVLDAEVRQAQKVVDDLDSRITELRLAKGAGGLSVDVVESARAGGPPTAPRKWLILAGAGMAGLLLGAGCAFLRGVNDARLHSGEEIESFMRLPILCGVPYLPGRGRRAARRRALTAYLDPASPAAEVYRMIRTAIQFGRPVKTLLITSPNEGEGKSTVACNLALVLAQAGERTLLVDADLRKPSVHALLGLDNETGMSSVLRGDAGLSEAVRATKFERLHVLPAGPIPRNPSELLNGPPFADMLRRLARHYDRIVFDAPPARVADPLILAAACDATVLVLRAGRSTRPACAAAYAGLAGVGARFLGVIANGVRSYPGYGYYGRLPAQPNGRSGAEDWGDRPPECGNNGAQSGRPTGYMSVPHTSAHSITVGLDQSSLPAGRVDTTFGGDARGVSAAFAVPVEDDTVTVAEGRHNGQG